MLRAPPQLRAAALPAHRSGVRVRRLASLHNPLIVDLRRLARDPAAYRQQGRVWIEGEHLCEALRARRKPAALALASESAWSQPGLQALATWAAEQVVVPDAVFERLSALPSPAGIGFVVARPTASWPPAPAPTVVLDGVQDAGNVGSILRTASALGVQQVLALRGTASLWSPKVLRAAMGAHFNLQLHEALQPGQLQDLALPLVGTGSHGGEPLDRCPLPEPCAWVFGHEGRGVSQEVQARCRQWVRIEQRGGEESLNVAAAAAICLYESTRRRPTGDAEAQ